MNQFLIDKLKQAGLEAKEASIYGFLVETGGAFPSAIAEQTKINRSTVYKMLIALSVKGLVAEIEKKKKLFYYPASPARFLRQAKQKIVLAEESYEKALKVLPELEGLFRSSESKPRVTYYEGKDQVVQAYMTQVEEKKSYELVSFASTNHLEAFLPPKVFKEYISLKNKYNITVRGIVPSTSDSSGFLERTHRNVKKSIVPVIRFVPHNLFPFSGEICMYQETKVLIAKLDGTNPIAVIIEDKAIFNMMKAIFELSWVGAKHIK
ncbi:MAG: hypothetical protein KBC12_00130 [Candidatus Pacebacteria bacterium]|nr:hypothetical protein [Candidatus Paceibacterota bacterium]MBP9851605.1 hypothetical protein [Candidatus Paceibacterota bacterium]